MPHTYQMTKYDPADRDEHGAYAGSLDSVSDHGLIEQAYLDTVAAFAAENGVTWLCIREPEIAGHVNFGLEAPVPGHGLDGLFPADLSGYHDGARVPLRAALELVRAMLRDNGAWCRLEVDDRFLVHVGYDQYVYIGSAVAGDAALAFAAEHGVFVEPIDASPWAFEADEDAGEQRAADEAFWADVRVAADERGSVLLQEQYVGNGNRWHRISPANVETARGRLAPRARLALWPDLSGNVVEVLAGVRDDELIEIVWQEHDAAITSLISNGLPPEVHAHLLDRATAVTILTGMADTWSPLLRATAPDPDGILRARWRI